MSILSPKEDKFFEMFISFSEIINKASNEFKDFINNLENREEGYKSIKALEHEGDEKLRLLFEELNKTFITPVDREDIHMIGINLDTILDLIENTASWFVMFNVDKSTDYAETFSNLIINCSKELSSIMVELKNMKKSDNLSKHIINIDRIEDEADLLFRRSVKELFQLDPSTNALQIIKWKQLYQNLEDIINAFEDVSNIIEGVVMKNA